MSLCVCVYSLLSEYLTSYCWLKGYYWKNTEKHSVHSLLSCRCNARFLLDMEQNHLHEYDPETCSSAEMSKLIFYVMAVLFKYQFYSKQYNVYMCFVYTLSFDRGDV